MRLFLTACYVLWMGLPAAAVEPDEVLADPSLEQRARSLSQNLRCLVCRNESIDESNSDLARDLRLLVRERLEAGDSNQQVLQFIVARYGEYVLFTPEKTGANWLLWASGPLGLLFACAIVLSVSRRQKSYPPDETIALSAEEVKKLKRLLDS